MRPSFPPVFLVSRNHTSTVKSSLMLPSLTLYSNSIYHQLLRFYPQIMFRLSLCSISTISAGDKATVFKPGYSSTYPLEEAQTFRGVKAVMVIEESICRSRSSDRPLANIMKICLS